MTMTMTLTLARLIMACSLSSEPHVEDMLYRVILATSQGQPYLVHDLSARQRYHVTDAARATQLLDGLLTAHHEVRIGLAGLSATQLRRWHVEDERAFDPCVQVRVASLELEEVLGKKLTSALTLQAQHEALARYFDAARPTSLDALDFGARVLAQPGLDVSVEVSSPHPSPSPTYVLERTSFFGMGAPITAGEHDQAEPATAGEAP